MLAYFAAWLGYRALDAAWGAPAASATAPGWYWEIVNALILAWLVAADGWAARSALREVRQLLPSRPGSDDGSRERAMAAVAVPSGLRRAGSALALAVAASILLFDPGIWPGVARPPLGDPGFLWVGLRTAAISWLVARALIREVWLTAAYVRIGSREVEIDLVDQRGLAPFGSKGQRTVVVWIGFSILFSLFFFGGSPARSNAFVVVGIVLLVSAAFAAPLIAVQRRVAAAKEAELDSVAASLRRERARTDPDDARLARLLAWQAHVVSVHEWPLTAPTLIRSALFVGLGVGSWFGGALVERLVAVALD